jgi:hypothetical protein
MGFLKKVKNVARKAVTAPARLVTQGAEHLGNLFSGRKSSNVRDPILDIADCLLPSPAEITLGRAIVYMRASAFLGRPVPENVPLKKVEKQVQFKIPWIGKTLTKTQWVKEDKTHARGAQGRNNVLQIIEEVIGFANKAKSAGFDPPDNPFAELVRLNTLRRPASNIPLPLSVEEIDGLSLNVMVYINLLQLHSEGALDLNKGTIDAAQLSHIHLSFEGLGGSGNTAADLMRFLPSMDEIKEKKAEEAFAVLDFAKRVPKVLFTMDYVPVKNGPVEGALIAWKWIPDASGYILYRRDVFSQTESEVTIENDVLRPMTEAHLEYAKTYGLTFFEDIDDSNVVLYVDKNIKPDEYYVYHLRAFRMRNDTKGAIFSGESVPVSLSSAMKLGIQQRMAELNPSGSVLRRKGADVISPWPVFAEQILGNSDMDWLLAAVNIRASVNRGDNRDVTRKYSYLNSRTDFLSNQADAGLLVRPASLDIVRSNIETAIQTFGVTQVIQELLTETGISYYFEGKDAREDTHFDRAGTLDAELSPLLGTVASAIDPETATLDLQSLASNLGMLIQAGPLGLNTDLSTAVPREIATVDPDAPTEGLSQDMIQFVGALGDMRDSVIDLTTFEGISKLMRTIRILSDFGPDRVRGTRGV